MPSPTGLMLMNAEGLKQLDQLRLAHSAGIKPSQAARMYYDGPNGQRRVPGRPELSVSNGVATISLCGPMFAEPDMMHTYFGMDQVVYGELVAVCAEVAGNAAITGVQLEIDTPGGDERGFDEAYAALCSLTAAKPTVARLRGCCSAGQWMAFACAKENTAAYPDALLGSIGCILMLQDKSKMYDLAGVRPVPVVSGDNKAFFGVDGLPITDKHTQNAMGLVVAPRFAQFKAAAITARGLADNAEVFDGRVLNAQQAVEAGLVSAVMKPAEMEQWATARLAALTSNATKDKTMSTPPTTTTTATMTAEQTAAAAAAAAAAGKASPATIAQMKAAFPTDAAFRAEQLEAGATLEQAQAAWSTKLAADLAAANARAEAAEAKLATTVQTPGNPKLATAKAGEGSPDAADAKLYCDKVDELALTLGSRAKAHEEAQMKFPLAYGAFRRGMKPA